LKNLNFYYMNTANIPVYGYIAVYIKYCAVNNNNNNNNNNTNNNTNNNNFNRPLI